MLYSIFSIFWFLLTLNLQLLTSFHKRKPPNMPLSSRSFSHQWLQCLYKMKHINQEAAHGHCRKREMASLQPLCLIPNDRPNLWEADYVWVIHWWSLNCHLLVLSSLCTMKSKFIFIYDWLLIVLWDLIISTKWYINAHVRLLQTS